LDPSSTCTGYAVLDLDNTLERGSFPVLIEHGRIKPERVRDAANDRIREMTREVIELCNEHLPAAIVIEDTSGKVSSRHGSGGGTAGARISAGNYYVGRELARAYRQRLADEAKRREHLEIGR